MSRRNTVRMLTGIAALALALATPDASASSHPRVFVVVVDGLEPESVSPELTPNLYALLLDGEARRYTSALANMVTETNANHVAMMTGAYGNVSGLVANSFWDRRSGQGKKPMERPELIMVPTLFDSIHAADPGLETAAVLGKEKLRKLFDACTRTASGACGPANDNPEGIAVTHQSPDFLWGASTRFDPDDETSTPAEGASGSGYALDNEIMSLVIRLYRDHDPDFTFVNLGGVDGLQHLFGAKSVGGRAAVINADVLIGRLVEALEEDGKWESSVLIVTADHSFQDSGDAFGTSNIGGNPAGPDLHAANPLTPQLTGSAIVLPEVLGSCSNATPHAVVSHGGSASVYLRPSASSITALTAGDKACLTELHDRALAHEDRLERPGLSAARYRLDVDGSGTDLLSDSGWNVDDPRIGELLLTANDGFWFLESRSSSGAVVAGNHGGPSARPIPFVVASGNAALAPGSDDENTARLVDIAPTVSALLGVAPPANNQGRCLAEAFPGVCP